MAAQLQSSAGADRMLSMENRLPWTPIHLMWYILETLSCLLQVTFYSSIYPASFQTR